MAKITSTYNSFFLRHPPTLSNINHIFMGQLEIPIVPVDYISLEEVKFSKELLIIASPLKRCHQTVEICTRQLDQYGVVQKLNIEFNDNLKERHLGDFQGKNKFEIRKTFSSFFKENTFIPTLTPPNGEDFLTFFNRVQSFYNYLCTLNNFEGPIIIISHLQVFKMLTCLHLELNVEDNWQKLKFENSKLVKGFI